MSGAAELAAELEEAERDRYQALLKLEAEDARTVASDARARLSANIADRVSRAKKDNRG